jgi:hypothetical protein
MALGQNNLLVRTCPFDDTREIDRTLTSSGRSRATLLLVLVTNALPATGLRTQILPPTSAEPISRVYTPGKSRALLDYYNYVPTYPADGRARGRAKPAELPEVKWDFWE